MTLTELETFLGGLGRAYPPVLSVGPAQFQQWLSEMQPVERWVEPSITAMNVYAPFRPRPLLVMSEGLPSGEFIPAPVEHGPGVCAACRDVLNGGAASHAPVST